MYEDFFNLKRKPFELLPNPEFLFESQSHKKALGYLRYGIVDRAGFILFTGEVGAGKTTIVRNIMGELDVNFTPSLVFNTRVSSEQLLALINEDFGLDAKGKEKVELLKELNEFLVMECAEGRRPVVIIDEAQNLSHEALEEVRMLSNLESPEHKLLQTILVGQPELRDKISAASMRQLRQRISINCHLRPLGTDEVRDYILHRLEVAGNREAAEFDEKVFDVIFNFSKGVPRLINVLCDFVFLSAYVEGMKHIDIELVEKVASEIGADFFFEQDEAKSQETLSIEQSLSELTERLSALEQSFVRLAPFEDKAMQVNDRVALLEKIIKHLNAIVREKNNKTDLRLRGILKRLRDLEG